VVVLGIVMAFAMPGPAVAGTISQRISRVLVKKADHEMVLFADDGAGERIVARYGVAIGPGGLGPKRMEGDMTTPVGRYRIVSHEASQYNVFLRLDYPNVSDHRRFSVAKQRGDLPASARIGGDIGIHGPPRSMDESERSRLKASDWTAGCIAVDEPEIREISRLVRDGTVVDIEP
jgi:murein L,D-transpeptidase YafK